MSQLSPTLITHIVMITVLALLAEVFLLNGVVSIVAASCFRKYGFLAAVGVRFWTDVVWHAIWGRWFEPNIYGNMRACDRERLREGGRVKPLRNREEWEAGFRSGWLAHWQDTGEIDWKRYPRVRNQEAPAGTGVALSTSRLMLITSSGAYLPGEQEPFDAENPLGDYSIRAFPVATPLDQLAYAHTHYDHAARQEDPQVLVPMAHLDAMVAEGLIGELAPSVISFMGYQPDVTRVIDETAAEALRVANEEEVDAALLVPA